MNDGFMLSKEMIDVLLNYGVLGVIGTIFLFIVIKSNKTSEENYKKLFDKVISSNDATMIEIKQLLTAISTQLQNHNSKANEGFYKLENSIDEYANKKVTLVTDMEKIAKEYDAVLEDYKTCVNVFRHQLLRMRELLISTNEEAAIIDELIGSGTIDKNVLQRIKTDIAKRDLLDEGIVISDD